MKDEFIEDMTRSDHETKMMQDKFNGYYFGYLNKFKAKEGGIKTDDYSYALKMSMIRSLK